MEKNPFEFEDNSLSLDLALTATEVGVEVLQSSMEYFSTMLLYSLQQVSELTGESIPDIKIRYEKELGLEKVIEDSLLTMRAAVEVIRDFDPETF